jgi:hypothetical protein
MNIVRTAGVLACAIGLQACAPTVTPPSGCATVQCLNTKVETLEKQVQAQDALLKRAKFRDLKDGKCMARPIEQPTSVAMKACDGSETGYSMQYLTWEITAVP